MASKRKQDGISKELQDLHILDKFRDVVTETRLFSDSIRLAVVESRMMKFFLKHGYITENEYEVVA